MKFSDVKPDDMVVLKPGFRSLYQSEEWQGPLKVVAKTPPLSLRVLCRNNTQRDVSVLDLEKAK